MRKALLIVALLAPGCGRIGFHDAAPDAAVDALAASVPPDAAPCGAGYALQSSTEPSLSRYRLGTATDWLSAEHSCEADGIGAHLVVLDDALEMHAIEAFYMSADTEIWLGLSDRVVDGTFKFVTSDMPAFLPQWNSPDNMPSHPGPGCVMFDAASREILDVDCSTVNVYVCECDGIAAVPGNY